MKFTYANLLMNEADPNNSGGGGGEPKKQDSTPPAQNNEKPEDGGDATDEFGYAKPSTKAEGEKDKAGDPPKESKQPEAKPDEEKVDDVIGYGNEPPKVEDKKEDPPKQDDFKFEIDSVDTRNLPKEDLSEIQKILKEEDPKKRAQLLLDVRAKQISDAQAAQQKAQQDYEREVQKVKSDWYNEVKENPTFGKEKWQQTVQNVNRILQDFAPEWKNELTKNKGMLPPVVVYGLARVAEKLYETPQLTSGDPKPPEKEPENPDAHLGFYKT